MRRFIETLSAKIRGFALGFDASRDHADKAPLLAAVAGGFCLLALVLLMRGGASSPDFSDYAAGDERKDAFFSYLLPLVEEHNAELSSLREEVLALSAEKSQLSFFEKRSVNALATTYEIEDFSLESDADWEILLRRIDIVPPSLALAQAANESAWGTSRFAREGNNYFGQWCYVQGCGIVPDARDAGATHEVAGFDSARESVEKYMHNLNCHPAYTELRQIRAQLRARNKPITGLDIAPGLGSYSERGEAYIEELSSMIRFNDLDQLDPGTAVKAD